MNYWIFKANPEKYDIDGRLLDPDPNIIWRVTRYHDRIQKGDSVFIWRTGTPRGICAVMKIEIHPYELQEIDMVNDGYEIAGSDLDSTNPNTWTKGQFIQRFPVIETSVIKKIPGLELFSFFSAFQQATNFSITRPEGAILLEFIEKYLAEEPIKKREIVRKPAAKIKKAEPVRTSGAGKNKSVKPTNKSSEFELLKCETCGRYVVKSDTDRHVREVHGSQAVEWKKMGK